LTGQNQQWRRFERSSDAYLAVTGLLLLLILAPILTSDLLEVERLVTAAVVGTSVTLSMAASGAPRWAIHASWIASLLVLISALFPSTPVEVKVAGVVTLAILMIALPVVILRRIGQHKVVTAITIFGAIAAYLAFGLAFSLLYAAIAQADSQAFTNLISPRLGDTNYFSFVTQTTLGYGDIIPVSDAPRALVVFQTLIGQIYLVVVVARVVSLLGKENQPLKRSPSD